MMMKMWVLTSQFPIAPGTAVASASTSEIALFFSRRGTRRATTFSRQSMSRRRRIRALPETKEPLPPSSSSSTAEETTKKYGLEFGLWKIFSSKEGEEGKEKSKAEQAKELLTKYGGAYLATSITLSLISFSLCYLLVNAGIDVPALLQKVGITVDETGGKVGTFALAYAAHKAASPIRFPPTVALTPVVAGWIGKNRNNNNKANDGADDDNL